MPCHHEPSLYSHEPARSIRGPVPAPRPPPGEGGAQQHPGPKRSRFGLGWGKALGRLGTGGRSIPYPEQIALQQGWPGDCLRQLESATVDDHLPRLGHPEDGRDRHEAVNGGSGGVQVRHARRIELIPKAVGVHDSIFLIRVRMVVVGRDHLTFFMQEFTTNRTCESLRIRRHPDCVSELRAGGGGVAVEDFAVLEEAGQKGAVGDVAEDEPAWIGHPPL